jgi:hypothetical protein
MQRGVGARTEEGVEEAAEDLDLVEARHAVDGAQVTRCRSGRVPVGPAREGLVRPQPAAARAAAAARRACCFRPRRAALRQRIRQLPSKRTEVAPLKQHADSC